MPLLIKGFIALSLFTIKEQQHSAQYIFSVIYDKNHTVFTHAAFTRAAFDHTAFAHAAFAHAAFTHTAFIHAAFTHTAFVHAAFTHTQIRAPDGTMSVTYISFCLCELKKF
jgi:uncharacterized protein YjbI with pentapeptide repeats